MALQVKHADAIGLLKTWYPTSDDFNPKKAAAKLRSLPERLASDPEAEKPTDKAALKTLESVIAAADAGDEIEVVVNGEANGNGHAKKNGKAPKAEAKPKGKKGTAPKKAGGDGKPGIIASVVEFLKTGSAKKPLTKADVVARLAKRFPDRKEEAMAKTVNVQIPTRLKSDKDITVKSNDEGYWIG